MSSPDAGSAAEMPLSRLWHAETRFAASLRRLELAVSAVGVLAAALLLALSLGWLTGHTVLIDRGDSMRPALRAGDLLLVRETPAEEIRTGDIVTFDDPVRERSVTHRVIERREGARYVDFVTRGDANSGVERWGAERGEPVKSLATALPGAGFALGWLTLPLVRFVTVTVCGLLLCALVLQRIWRS